MHSRWRAAISPYAYVPLLAICALLQVTVAPHLTILGGRPDLMLQAVVAWGLLRGSRQGLIWGFVGGMWISMFSGGPFGAPALVLMAVGALIGLGQAYVWRGHVAMSVLAAVVGSVVSGGLSLFLLYVSGRSVPWLDTAVRVMLPSTLLNGLLIVPVSGLFYMLHRRAGRETR